MRRRHFIFLSIIAGVLILAPCLSTGPAGMLNAKEKNAIPADDPTTKLFQFLDTSYGGKVEDFYVIGEIFKASDHPDQDWQHILRVEYGKDKPFGKFTFYVRNISKPTPDQLKVYTPKALYDFGSDAEKFVKTAAGSFGQPGDVYLRADGDSPLATSPISPEIQAAYQKYLTATIMPALEKAKKAD